MFSISSCNKFKLSFMVVVEFMIEFVYLIFLDQHGSWFRITVNKKLLLMEFVPVNDQGLFP